MLEYPLKYKKKPEMTALTNDISIFILCNNMILNVSLK